MMLIGMFDSPYVRRVAVTLKHHEVPFEHANWSVGADLERIREFSPLGRVPVLVLNDGTALTDSAAILDEIDDQVGPSRALLPASGASRCREQMHGAPEVIEVHCREIGRDVWLVDDRFSQADITVTCISTFLGESLDALGDARYPALRAHVERCEALPEFRATHSPWFAAAMRA